MKYILQHPVLIALLLFFLCTYNGKAQKTYSVYKANSDIIIDGKGNDKAWANAEERSFNNFYDIERPTDKQFTKFKMMWDDENLYLLYQCEDKYITARETERDGVPFLDDCVEIFLIPADTKLNMHLGFEINPYKASNDFIYLNKIHKNKKMVIKSYSPNFDVEVTIDGTINDNSDIDNGWTLEMAIPLKAFHISGNYTPIAEGVKWNFFALRKDRNDIECDRVSQSTIFPTVRKHQQVHNKNHFGLMEFMK